MSSDPSETRLDVRLVPMTREQRDIIVRLINGSPSVLWRGSGAYDERMGHLIAMADGWDAAPADPVAYVSEAIHASPWFGGAYNRARMVAIDGLSALGLRVGVHHDNGETT